MRNLRGIRDKLLSDQLSDYRVDDPYIQVDIHGPIPRSVIDLDGSPTVLRYEAVTSLKIIGVRSLFAPARDWVEHDARRAPKGTLPDTEPAAGRNLRNELRNLGPSPAYQERAAS